jgi:hypothetical protein
MAGAIRLKITRSRDGDMFVILKWAGLECFLGWNKVAISMIFVRPDDDALQIWSQSRPRTPSCSVICHTPIICNNGAGLTTQFYRLTNDVNSCSKPIGRRNWRDDLGSQPWFCSSDTDFVSPHIVALDPNSSNPVERNSLKITAWCWTKSVVS